MGSQMEKILDYEGKSYAIFDESSLYDDNQIGNKLSDFEILEVLNDDSNPNFIAKVRSIKNHKIYALKRINIQNYNSQFYEQQIKNLILLNNPHLIKYYTYFFENGCLFLVMEYMNNSDIDGFRKAHQVLGKNIKEEEIWNILLQCLSALEYVYNTFINQLGFKICNIFMNNEQNAKIGLSPSNANCTDICLLGKCFYAMCFSQEGNVKDKKFFEITFEQQQQQQQSLIYSNELLSIIDIMLNDINNNVNISELYNKVKDEYCKKYAKNSSINSVLRCLYSYPKLNDIISKNENLFSSSQKYFISYNYLMAIRTLQGAYENNLSKFIEEFRRAIATENSKLDGSKEIDPLYLLAFLLEKMHKEMNVIEESELNEGEEVDRTNKEQTFNQFVNFINSNINSPISDLFLGINKTKRICQSCKNGYYSFNNFCFVIFDLTVKNHQNFNLFKDGFLYQYNYEKELLPDNPDHVSCEKCLTYQFHYEFNRFYVMSKQLIISFLRGNNYENRTRVDFPEKLDLSQLVDEKDISQFYLVGCIIRILNQDKEEFIYWAKDPDNNLWHKSNINFMNHSSYLDEHTELNIQEIMQTGQIIILFYNEVNNK